MIIYQGHSTHLGAVLINFFVPNAAVIRGWGLIGSGAYLSNYGNHSNNKKRKLSIKNQEVNTFFGFCVGRVKQKSKRASALTGYPLQSIKINALTEADTSPQTL